MISELLQQCARYTAPSQRKFYWLLVASKLCTAQIYGLMLILIFAIYMVIAHTDIMHQYFSTKQLFASIVTLIATITILSLIKSKIIFYNGLYAMYGLNDFNPLDEKQIECLKMVCKKFPDVQIKVQQIDLMRRGGFNQFDYYQLQIYEYASHIYKNQEKPY